MFIIICIATLVEIFSKNRQDTNDIEIQNNNNNIDDLKTSKSSVLTKDLHLLKPKRKEGK